MDKVQAINDFWNSFGLKAYDATSVPDETSMPYITYELPIDTFGQRLSASAKIWYRSSSWREIQLKEQQIANCIGRGGRMLHYDDGAVWIQRGTPWALRLSGESDEYVRCISLNVEIEFCD